MQNRDDGTLEFYPANLFHLSPTYSTWARLAATDVHRLRERPGFEGQSIYFYLNHPIKYVRLVGVIVAFDVLPARFLFVLDDSSGATIDVICKRPKAADQYLTKDGILANAAKPFIPPQSTKGLTSSGIEVDLAGIDVGTIVKVKGTIGSWRDERQLLLERVWVIRSTHEETAAWIENQRFFSGVLSQPWILSEKEVKKAQRKAEGSGLTKRSQGWRRIKTGKTGKSGESRVSDDDDGQGKAGRHGRKRAEASPGKQAARQKERRERELAMERRLQQRCDEETRLQAQRQNEQSFLKETETASARGANEERGGNDPQHQHRADRLLHEEKEQARRRRADEKAERERIFAERRRLLKPIS